MTQALATEALADDAELVATALQDADTFGSLYERYLARVFGYMLSRCSSRDEAADLTQLLAGRPGSLLPKPSGRSDAA